MTLGSNRSSRRPLPRASAVLAGFAVVTASWLAIAPAAQADTGLAVTGTSVTKVAPGTTTDLTGLAVTGAAPTDDLQVTVGTDVGTLTVNDLTGVTLAYGNSASGDSSVSFNGLSADVNNALASVELVTTSGDAGSQATVSLSAMPYSAGLVYSPDNGHFYQFINSPALTWDQARTEAATQSFAGQQGYLASIPSQAVNDLITSKIQGAENVWIGAVSTDDPFGSPARQWHWADGPLAGTVFSSCTNWDGVCDFDPPSGAFAGWAFGEPNNAGAGPWSNSGEWVAVTNWFGPFGAWNDLPADAGFNIAGYVVEYGDQVEGSTGFTDVVNTSSQVDVRGVPTAPTNASATSGDESSVVSWDAPADDGGAAISGYTVTVSPGGATVACDESPCTITGLTNGTEYTFTVHATNAEGDSPESDPTEPVTPRTVPAPPTGVTATAGNGIATVSWQTQTDDGGSAITGYTVTVAPGGATVACASSPCEVGDLANGTAYTFTVHATNAEGDSPESAPTSPVVPSSRAAAPGALTATPGDRVLTLSFEPPAITGDWTIDGYRYSLDRGKTWHPLAVTMSGVTRPTLRPAPLTGRIEGVLNGKRYVVTVRAKTSAGAGEASRPVAVTPPLWFHDPLTAQARKALAKVPAKPATYHGKVARTEAYAASRNGTPAFPATELAGRQLQLRQAVSFSAGEMFRFDSAVVTPAGRREIRAVVKSLTYVEAVQCEGYSDYGGSVANEWRLSRTRAAAVCRLLKTYGADVSTGSRGFGPTRPAIIGGSTAARDDNRRVVLLVTG